jgi:hypothetical protein
MPDASSLFCLLHSLMYSRLASHLLAISLSYCDTTVNGFARNTIILVKPGIIVDVR